MDQLEAVFIDAGGVLVLPDLQHLAGLMGITASPDDCYAAWFGAYELADHSRPEPEWLWEAFAVELGIAAEDAADARLAMLSAGDPWWDGQLIPAPGAIEFLERLKAADVPAVVVSNASGTVDQLLRRAGVCQVGPGPLTEVTGIIDSTIVGVAKPDPRIWDFAFSVVEEHAGEMPDRSNTFHVGDALWSDVRGAVAANIPVVHLDPRKGCVEPDDHDHVAHLLHALPASSSL